MTYQVKRQNGSSLDEPFYSRIVDAYIKDKSEVHFNWQTLVIEGAKVADGVTTITVRVK